MPSELQCIVKIIKRRLSWFTRLHNKTLLWIKLEFHGRVVIVATYLIQGDTVQDKLNSRYNFQTHVMSRELLWISNKMSNRCSNIGGIVRSFEGGWGGVGRHRAERSDEVIPLLEGVQLPNPSHKSTFRAKILRSAYSFNNNCYCPIWS